MIDVFIVRHPHRLLLFIYPMICGVAYLLFTVVYTIAGGKDGDGNNFIYPILDWNRDPLKATVVGIGSIVLLSIFHVIVCGMHHVRNKIHQCITSRIESKAGEQILPFVNTQEAK